MLYTGADGSTSGGGMPTVSAMWCAMMGATERMTSLRRTCSALGSGSGLGSGLGLGLGLGLGSGSGEGEGEGESEGEGGG